MFHGSTIPEVPEVALDISLYLRNAKPSDPPAEGTDCIGSSDSFQKGAADEGAFDTGLTRLFKIAIIEFEYALAAIADAPI